MDKIIKNMKILVTGGAGFMGSHLCDALIEKGNDVIIIDDLSSGRTENINKKAKFFKLNINSPQVRTIFSNEKPNVVYHLAFNTNVPRAIKDPLYDIQSLNGSLNIIENCYRINVPRIIFSSSGFIYGNANKLPTNEDAPFQPISPYAISKYTVEQYLKFYKNSYGLTYVILRFATVYGQRQIGQAMADYIRKIANDKRAEMYGKTLKTRDYVFIKDVVSSLLLALDYNFSPTINPIFNVGTGIETSLKEVYSLICDFLKKKSEPIYMPARYGELQRFCLDYSKIKDVLGWSPKYSLQDGLKEILRYKH